MLPTAQSPTLSSVLDQLTAVFSAGVDGPGIDEALHQFAGVPYQTVNKTGFNVLALHVNGARGMVLSHPEMALRPWPAYKSFAPRVRRPPIPQTTVCLRRQPIDPLFCSCSTLFASVLALENLVRLFVSASSSLPLCRHRSGISSPTLAPYITIRRRSCTQLSPAPTHSSSS